MKPATVAIRFAPFLLVLCIASAARIAVFRGFAASDDADYAQVAWQMSQGRFDLLDPAVPPHYPTRVGIVAPLALLFKVFGVHEWTLMIIPVFASAAMLALAYAFGKILFSRAAGLLAMAIYAILPIDCRFATWFLSDTPAVLWAGIGVLLLILGLRSPSSPRKSLAGLAAALCFGVSWLTRTQVAQLAPFILGLLAIWTWRDRKNLPMAATLFLGVAAIFLAEGFCYLGATGDFFYPLHAGERMYSIHSQWYYFKEGSPYGWTPGHYWPGLIRRLFWKGPEAVFLNPDFALVPLIALLAVGHAALWRRREYLLPAGWFLWSVLAFNFGSASVRRYEPLPWVNAYMVPILLPAAVVVGGWLSQTLHIGDKGRPLQKEQRYWSRVACAAIALAALFGLYQHARQGIGCQYTRPAAPVISKFSDRPLYTDAMTIRGLKFFWKYHYNRDLRELGQLDLKTVPDGAEVFLNFPEIQRMRDQIGYEPPGWVNAPSADWSATRRWPAATLYRAGENRQ